MAPSPTSLLTASCLAAVGLYSGPALIELARNGNETSAPDRTVRNSEESSPAWIAPPEYFIEDIQEAPSPKEAIVASIQNVASFVQAHTPESLLAVETDALDASDGELESSISLSPNTCFILILSFVVDIALVKLCMRKFGQRGKTDAGQQVPPLVDVPGQSMKHDGPALSQQSGVPADEILRSNAKSGMLRQGCGRHKKRVSVAAEIEQSPPDQNCDPTHDLSTQPMVAQPMVAPRNLEHDFDSIPSNVAGSCSQAPVAQESHVPSNLGDALPLVEQSEDVPEYSHRESEGRSLLQDTPESRHVQVIQEGYDWREDVEDMIAVIQQSRLPQEVNGDVKTQSESSESNIAHIEKTGELTPKQDLEETGQDSEPRDLNDSLGASLRGMLQDDPIVQKYPQYLPTEEEVCQARKLLLLDRNKDLYIALCEHVRIGGGTDAALWRFCWQAREEGHVGLNAVATGALAWLQRCLDARSRLRMDSQLFDSGFTWKFHELYFRAIAFSFHGTDRQGHPIIIQRYGSTDMAAFKELWNAGELMAKNGGVNGAVMFHLRAMEYLTKVVMAQESLRQGRVVDRVLLIADLEGAGYQHLDKSVKAFFGKVAEESKLLFPETMYASIVVNVPWILERVIWPIVRVFLHPVTQSKFSFDSTKAKLAEYVDMENLPPYLGGTCCCAECLSGHLQGGSMSCWEAEKDLLKHVSLLKDCC